jgi:hypothetical protein
MIQVYDRNASSEARDPQTARYVNPSRSPIHRDSETIVLLANRFTGANEW